MRILSFIFQDGIRMWKKAYGYVFWGWEGAPWIACHYLGLFRSPEDWGWRGLVSGHGSPPAAEVHSSQDSWSVLGGSCYWSPPLVWPALMGSDCWLSRTAQMKVSESPDSFCIISQCFGSYRGKRTACVTLNVVGKEPHAQMFFISTTSSGLHLHLWNFCCAFSQPLPISGWGQSGSCFTESVNWLSPRSPLKAFPSSSCLGRTCLTSCYQWLIVNFHNLN